MTETNNAIQIIKQDDTMSSSIGNLGKALSEAQAEITFAPKNSTNPFFRSTYADLATIWESIRGPLTKHGLSVVQTTTPEFPPAVVTTLIHESGEWIRGITLIHPKKDKNGNNDDPQAVGGAITYARRYALAAIVGIAQDDDDGESAMGRSTHQKSSATSRSNAVDHRHTHKLPTSTSAGTASSDDILQEAYLDLSQATKKSEVESTYTKFIPKLKDKPLLIAKLKAARDKRLTQVY